MFVWYAGFSARYLHDTRRSGAQIRRRIDAAERPYGRRAAAGVRPSVDPGRPRRPALRRRCDGDGRRRVHLRRQVRRQCRAAGPSEPHRVPAGLIVAQAPADPVDADGQLRQDDDVLRQAILEARWSVWRGGYARPRHCLEH